MQLGGRKPIEHLSDATKKEIQDAAIGEFNLRHRVLENDNGIDLIKVYEVSPKICSSKEISFIQISN